MHGKSVIETPVGRMREANDGVETGERLACGILDGHFNDGRSVIGR